jgi:pyruvate dehydrogenase (quinone)
MAKPTVAAKVVETLAQAGVRRVYGVVGDSLNSIVDEVRRSDAVDWIHVRNEESGAFAAGAEAQLDGQLAVCAGSCGPGSVHLINGLYDCHRSMAPVLGIASHIPSSEIGTGYYQEIHPDRLFVECSHYCELISSPNQVPRTVQIAIQNAVGKGGVSVIGLPGDVATQTVPDDSFSHGAVVGHPTTRPSDEGLGRLADLLNGAERVTLFCGRGCAGAHDELMTLCERLGAPMVHALRGKEHLEYDNPYDVGMTGLIGFPSGYRAMESSDVLLMLGTDFPYDDWYPKRAKIAQVDIRPEHLGRRCRLDLGLIGDVRHVLQALLPLLEQKSDRSHLEECLKHYRKTRRTLDSHVRGIEGHRPIHPEYLTTIISELADDDAVFAADNGMCTVWAARYLRMTEGRRLLGSFVPGSMANALPQAIGAKLLYPDRQVISLSGDGGFAMLMGDFITLSQYDLPVKTVVYNNGALGMVRLEMEVDGLPDYGTDLKNPNFAKMAEAMGVTGIRVEDPTEVRPAIERALAHDGPVLVDVVTNPSELAMPPKTSVKQAKGFSLYLLKETLSGHGDDMVEMIEDNLLR